MNEKTINILMIGTLDGIKGGVANYIHSIINGKGKEKINFYLACIENSNLIKEAQTINFDIRYSPLTLLLRLKQLKRIIKKHNIDIIHAHTQRGGLLAAILNFKKFVYTPHGLRYLQVKGIKRIKHYYFDKFILKRASIITALTSSELKEIQKIDIQCFAYQINTRIDDRYIGLKKSKIFTLIMVGSCDNNKNPSLFIKIAENLNEIDLKFIWVGDGPLIDECREVCARKNLNNVSFVGQKDHNMSIRSIETSHIMLFTSKMESFPISIIESMMCKTLVFSNNYTGVQDILQHNETGMIYDLENTEKACKELKALIQNKKKRTKIVNIARKKFLTHYNSSELIFKEYLSIYHKCLIE